MPKYIADRQTSKLIFLCYALIPIFQSGIIFIRVYNFQKFWYNYLINFRNFIAHTCCYIFRQVDQVPCTLGLIWNLHSLHAVSIAMLQNCTYCNVTNALTAMLQMHFPQCYKIVFPG